MLQAGGFSVTFDASESYDPEKTKYAVRSNGIASYGWDFDSDGKIDDFGRSVTHHFDKAGDQKVSLQVLDSHGAAQTITQTVKVSPLAYSNPFIDGDISSKTKLGKIGRLSSLVAGKGWQGAGFVRKANGTMAANGVRQARLGQVIQNDGLHKGEQTLSFRLKNIEGSKRSSKNNIVTVQMWGVDGQFDGSLGGNQGPVQSGTRSID